MTSSATLNPEHPLHGGIVLNENRRPSWLDIDFRAPRSSKLKDIRQQILFISLMTVFSK